MIILPCPGWCTIQHEPPRDPTDDIRVHEVSIGELRYGTVSVVVRVADDLTAGTRGTLVATIRGDGVEELTGDQARHLAAVLVEAAAFLSRANVKEV